MRQFVSGTLLAALAMFVWGFVFWAVPWPNPAYRQLDAAAEEALRQSLSVHVPATGAYYLPDVSRAADMEQAASRHLEGPLATIFVRKEGAAVMSPGIFVAGFLHMLFTALLLALLLRGVGPVLRSYGSRVQLVALVGLAAAVWANLGDPIWNYHPWAFHLARFVYDLASWVVAGLVLARFVKPRVKAFSAA